MTDKPEQLCGQLAEALSAYLDGQLPDDQAARVEAHLKACPACARKLEHYRQIRSLIQTDPAKCPIDLTTAVLANLEREQLLTGLDDLAKPPPVLGSRLLRALAAAAMIGLVLYAGSFIFQFSTGPGSPDRTLSKDKTEQEYRSFAQADRRQDAVNAYVPARPAAPTAVIRHAKPAAPPALGPTSSQPDRDAPLPATKRHIAEQDLDEKAMPPAYFAAPAVKVSPRAFRAKELSVIADAKEVSSTRPSEPAMAAVRNAGSGLAKDSSDRVFARQIPLVFTLSAPDMPTWMLAKEQVLQALAQDRIEAVTEPDQFSGALAENRPFYFQARKGLELPTGSTRGQILVALSPRQFVALHNRLQQPDLDPIHQTLHPELEKLLGNPTVGPGLATLARQTARNLDCYLVRRGVLPAVAEVSSPATTNPAAPSGAPTTTQMFAYGNSTLALGSGHNVPSSAPAAQKESRTIPSNLPKTDTAPAVGLVPVLIDIELTPPSPTSQPVEP